MFSLIGELWGILEAQLELTPAFESATGRIVLYLFHRDREATGDFRKTWTTACRADGVPGKLLHNFRQSAVRNAKRASAPRSSALTMSVT